jgi:hypothetical protein
MNDIRHTFTRPDQIDQIARELSEIDALRRALEKREHFLKRARYWEAVAGGKGRQYARNMDHADSYQPEILLAMYALTEIDAIHAAYLECDHG